MHSIFAHQSERFLELTESKPERDLSKEKPGLKSKNCYTGEDEQKGPLDWMVIFSISLSTALVKELEKQSVYVLPLLHRKCDIPILLREKVYADFTTSYEDGLQSLADRLAPEVDALILKGLMSDNYQTVRLSWNKATDSSRQAYIAIIKNKLSSDFNEEKRAAMTALYIIDRNILRPHLVGLASGSETTVVRNALLYIGELCMKEGISIVSQKMSDGTPHIRAAARDAYKKLQYK